MSEHGTHSCYSKGCRRPECRAAETAYRYGLTLRRYALRVPVDGRLVAAHLRPEQHGKCGYINHGCRCAVCTEGNRVAQQEWRERQG